jgi:ATP-dependent DNA ligase
VESLARLRSQSCIIDGEAVACDESGVPSFERIRYRRHDTSVFLYAFDLIELNGDDLRRDPLEIRKVMLANVLAGTAAIESPVRSCGPGATKPVQRGRGRAHCDRSRDSAP